LKIDFMQGPSSYVYVSSFGSRILTENLLRDDRLETTFNKETILNEIRTQSYIRDKVAPKLNDLRSDISKVYGIGLKSAASVYASYRYCQNIPNTVKSDTVLYSANNGVFDFPTIMSLLNAGIRVVVGGPTATITDSKIIREQFIKHGAKNLQNLILVSGFVDLKTDLYKIVNDWKDVVIESNDFTTLWDCQKDFMHPYMHILRRIPKKTASFKISTIFKGGCWWGKCTFCNYGKIPAHLFVEDTSVEKVAESLIKSCDLYNTDKIFVADDYFLFTDFNEAVFKILKEHKIKIEIYSGIHMLKNIPYIKKVNKYINSISLGVESFDNFSLKYINKGYNRNDINKAFENVSKYCSDLEVVMMLMMDLPVKRKEDVIENYKNIKITKEKLNANGINVHMIPKLLEISWALRKTFPDNQFLKVVSPDAKDISGRYIIWQALEELGVVDRKVYKSRTTPFKRYGSDGNVIKSDLFIIPDDIFEGLKNED